MAREPSQEQTASMIADTLGEAEADPRAQIGTIVQTLGRTQAKALLQEALKIEQNGGMMVSDGSRRRTSGGVFFYLAYTKGKPKSGKKLVRPSEQSKPFTWDERFSAVQEAEKEKGIANVKITVVGRPGKIVDRGQCIVTIMESGKAPTLPKGLPTPTTLTARYAVYIAMKQWKKVEQALTDPEDVLIVEGFPTTDAPVSAIAVFATNVTTKKLQQAQRAANSE